MENSEIYKEIKEVLKKHILESDDVLDFDIYEDALAALSAHFAAVAKIYVGAKLLTSEIKLKEYKKTEEQLFDLLIDGIKELLKNNLPSFADFVVKDLEEIKEGKENGE